MSETAPMRSLVERLSEACSDWLEVDGLPSPPATAKMLRATDKDLAEAVKVLCRAYPKKLGWQAADRIEALEAALAGLEPYLDAIVCYASSMDEHEPNRLAVNARAALNPPSAEGREP